MRIKNRPSRVVAEMGTPDVRSPASHVAPLHVLWDVGETAVLADAGPSEGAGSLTDWLASPAAHNVLLLDGHTLADAVPAVLGVARVDGKKARIEGHHTGWHRYRVPLTHERDVLLNQARLVITDRLVPVRPRVVHLALSQRRGSDPAVLALLAEQRRTNRLLQALVYGALGFVAGALAMQLLMHWRAL
jgi:hypothetical protein